MCNFPYWDLKKVQGFLMNHVSVIGYKQLNHDDDAENTALTLILPH